MVHIELCHPNMEVKIHENRVREQDFYYDLNSSDVSALARTTPEPQMKKRRRSVQSDAAFEPINGVAIALNTLIHDGNELSPLASEELYDVDQLESVLLSAPDLLDNDNEQDTHTIEPLMFTSSPPSSPPRAASPTPSDDGNYLLVYNRPKQFYGSLYEPDKQ